MEERILTHPPSISQIPPAGILDGQNGQSPIASVQRTWLTLEGLSAAPRGTLVARMSANRAIRIAAQ